MFGRKVASLIAGAAMTLGLSSTALAGDWGFSIGYDRPVYYSGYSSVRVYDSCAPTVIYDSCAPVVYRSYHAPVVYHSPRYYRSGVSFHYRDYDRPRYDRRFAAGAVRTRDGRIYAGAIRRR